MFKNKRYWLDILYCLIVLYSIEDEKQVDIESRLME